MLELQEFGSISGCLLFSRLLTGRPTLRIPVLTDKTKGILSGLYRSVSHAFEVREKHNPVGSPDQRKICPL